MFVIFETVAGDEIAANPALVKAVAPDPRGGTCYLAFDEDDNVHVKGSFETVVAKLNKGLTQPHRPDPFTPDR